MADALPAEVVQQFLLASVPAGAAAAVVLAAAWWARRGPAEHAPVEIGPRDIGWRGAVAPLLAAAAFVATQVLIVGMPSFPPTAGRDWLPAAALAGAALGGLAVAARFPWLVRWGVRGVVLAGAGFLVSMNMVRGSWSGAESAGWIGGLLAAGLAHWWAAERLADRLRGPAAPAVLAATALAAAQVLAAGFHNNGFGLLAQSLGAVLAGATVAALLRPALTLAYGGAHVAALLLPLLLYQAVVFSEEPAWQRFGLPLVLLASPALALLADVGPLARVRGVRRTLVRIALGAGPALAAAGLTVALRLSAAASTAGY